MRFECVNIRAVVSTSNRPEFTSPRGPLSLDQCEGSSGLGCGPNQWPLVCLKVQLSKTIHSPEWVNANRQIEQQAKTGSDVEHSAFWEKKTNAFINSPIRPSVRPSMSSVSLRCLGFFLARSRQSCGDTGTSTRSSLAAAWGTTRTPCARLHTQPPPSRRCRAATASTSTPNTWTGKDSRTPTAPSWNPTVPLPNGGAVL